MTEQNRGHLRITTMRGKFYDDGPAHPLTVRIEQAGPVVEIQAPLFKQPPLYVQVNGDLITFRGDDRTVTYRQGEYLADRDTYVCYLTSRWLTQA